MQTLTTLEFFTRLAAGLGCGELRRWANPEMKARPATRAVAARVREAAHWPVRAYHVVLNRPVVAGGRSCGG